MILVDTSVWIDHLRGFESPEAKFFVRLVSEDQDLCTCGLIVTEVMQGIRQERQVPRIWSRLSSLIYLPMPEESFDMAAYLYRTARKRGNAIRNTMDCLVAACAITHNVPLLQRDKDFVTIAGVSNLVLVTP